MTPEEKIKQIKKIKTVKSQRIIVLILMINGAIGMTIGTLFADGNFWLKFFLSSVPLIFVVSFIYELVLTIKIKVPKPEDLD